MTDWKGERAHISIYKYQGEDREWLHVHTIGIWMDIDTVIDIFKEYPIRKGYKIEITP